MQQTHLGRLDAVRACDLELPKRMAPRKPHRFPGTGKTSGNHAGWCVLFEDGSGACFSDCSTGADLALPQWPVVAPEHLTGFNDLASWLAGVSRD